VRRMEHLSPVGLIALYTHMVKKALTRYDNIIIFNDFRISFTLIGLSVRFVLNILQSLIYKVHILGVMVDDCKKIFPVLRRVTQVLIRRRRGPV